MHVLVECYARIMRVLNYALFLVCLLLSQASAAQLDVDDSVLESGRYGTDVVLLVIGYVQQAKIFAHNSKLLRRIAYVETQDGTNREAFNEGMNGGIWAVREDAFTSTQIGGDPFLARNREQIKLTFGINWKSVQWSELSKPLYSALAAQLVIFTAQLESIPSDIDVMSQVWRENRTSSGDFITKDKRWKSGLTCVV